MTSYTFKKATKEQIKARIALIGPSGSGKTYTALRLAQVMGSRVALIDTENHSASLYAGEFNFDTLALDSVSPQSYIQAIRAAENAGYNVLIIDSLSHAWAGKDGALAMADAGAAKYRGNTFAAWRDVTPHHNALVDALINCKCHLIAAMRSKMEYIIEEEKGKMVPKKVGMAPIQRQGMEYEFDIVGDLDLAHNLIISKTRCKALDGQVIALPGEELGQTILDWLTDGAEPESEKTADETPPNGLNRLLEEVNQVLAENGLEQYDSPDTMKAMLKDLGHTGYAPSKHTTMRLQLISRKEPNGKASHDDPD